MKELTALITPSKEHPSRAKSKDTFQSILGLSNEMLLWIYGVGHQLHIEKKHEKALIIFNLLVTLNPLVADYFVAKGLTERSLEKNTEALYSFAMASMMNPHHPVARYNAAEIYLQNHKQEDARLEFEVLEEIVRTGKHEQFRPAVEAMRGKVVFIKKAS